MDKSNVEFVPHLSPNFCNSSVKRMETTKVWWSAYLHFHFRHSLLTFWFRKAKIWV